MEKVSIIIPVYNVENYIEKCLDSVLNQTYRNIEYILIDDCGTDRSIPMAEKIVNEHPRKEQVKWIRQETNQGQSVARNRGAEIASGNYLFFIDSDDFITPECIETHVKYMEKEAPDVTVGSIAEVAGEKILKKGILETKFLKGREVWESFTQFKWYFTPWNKLIKKDFFLRNHLWFEKGIIYEDHLWNFQVALASQRLYLFSETTYFYSIRPASSIRSQVTAFNFASWEKVLQKMKQISFEKGMQHDKAAIKAFEYSKLKKMESLVHDYASWKKFRPLSKIKMAPTWQLLLGYYGPQLRNRAFLSVLPYFLYRPFYQMYRCLGK